MDWIALVWDLRTIGLICTPIPAPLTAALPASTKGPSELGGKYQCIFSWGMRPALLEEIKALKGKHKMSLMVLIKAPVLIH